MNFRKLFMLFVFVVIPATAGFAFTPQPNPDNDKPPMPLSPGTIVPGDQGSGTLSIVPGEKDNTKIQYRNILFGWGEAKDKDQGSPGNSNNMYDQSAPDKDKGSRDPDNPMNKSFVLPPGADQAKQSESDQDSPGVSRQDKDQDPSLSPARNGNHASQSRSNELQYVANEPMSEYYPQYSEESSEGGSMDEDFSTDRDLGADSDGSGVGDSKDLDIAPDQGEPEDLGTNL